MGVVLFGCRASWGRKIRIMEGIDELSSPILPERLISSPREGRVRVINGERSNHVRLGATKDTSGSVMGRRQRSTAIQ